MFSDRLVSLCLPCLAVATLLAACSGPDASVEATDGDNALVTNRGEGKDEWWNALPRKEWAEFPRVETSQNWFEVYDVGSGVKAIYEPGQFEEVISYLIEGDESALLFDSGLGIGDMGALVAELTRKPVMVLNSHTHYDHIGGNHQFDFILAQTLPYTVERSRGLGNDKVGEYAGPGWIWKDTPEGFDPDTFQTRPFGVSRSIKDGETIELGGRTLEVLFTPGHAPDALCLVDRAKGLLFVGDTFYLAPLYTHLEGSDFSAYQETARMLAELAPSLDQIFPGHNVTGISPTYLVALRDAFDAIDSGDAPFVETDGHREYAFDGFSVITEP